MNPQYQQPSSQDQTSVLDMVSPRELQESSVLVPDPQSAAPVQENNIETDSTKINTNSQAIPAGHSRARAKSHLAPGFVKGADGYLINIDKGEELYGPGFAKRDKLLPTLIGIFVQSVFILAVVVLNAVVLIVTMIFPVVKILTTKAYNRVSGRRHVPVQSELRESQDVPCERRRIVPTLTEEGINPLVLDADAKPNDSEERES